MTRIVCIGECMVELRAVGADTFARSYAGDAYNTAVYLKRSLPDAQVQFLTATGDDAMSQAMRQRWRIHQIDDALAFPVPGGSAGLYLIETAASGERSFQYWRKDSAAKRWLAQLQERGESVLWGADMVYYSGITLAILNPGERAAALELLARARPHIGRIAFDPNVRLRLWESPQVAAQIILAAISACDIALPSTEDLAWLLGTAEPERQVNQLLEIGTSEVALTLGADGCSIAARELRVQLSGQRVAGAIDTSGAGDAFNGVYLANRLKGNSPDQAAESALRVASRVVTHAGAIVPNSVSHPAKS
ncbi:MAG TPA: sugar kinase [Steroidobacteraceae bacterium]|nr:sugar kinase [Steroidobacteraceae bacterium]